MRIKYRTEQPRGSREVECIINAITKRKDLEQDFVRTILQSCHRVGRLHFIQLRLRRTGHPHAD